MKKAITIATRESPLALWQANWVKVELEKHYPLLEVKLLGMTTQADRMPYISLAEVGGKGLFVKELEQALLDHRADIAVHSIKDMPMELPAELCMPVMCERESPFDAFVSNHYSNLAALPINATLGTSSVRRKAQLLALRPDLNITFLRGNVNTRLKKLDTDEFAAIILAVAGLKRLGFEDRIQNIFTADELLPAVGQGVLGIECRKSDAEIQQVIAVLNDPISFQCVTAERAMCLRLGGGCQTPVATFAEKRDNNIILRGRVPSVDGKIMIESCLEHADPEFLGNQVAEELLRQGADKLLQTFRK